MMINTALLNWGVMALAVILFVIVGLRACKVSSEGDESNFLIAGRSLTPFVGAASIVATAFSGFGFTGSPGVSYQFGAIELLANSFFAPAIILCILYFANTMQKLAMTMGSCTIPEFIGQRHSDSGCNRLLQASSAVITAVLLLIFLTSQVKALGLLSSHWLGLSLNQGAALMLCIILVYTILGGLTAAAWADTIMALGMTAGAIIIGQQVFSDLSLTELLHELSTQSPQLVNPDQATPYGTYKYSVFLALPYAIMFTAVLPYISVRFLAFKPNTNFRTVAFYATPMALLLSIIPIVGLYVRAKHPALELADMAMPYYLQAFMHPLVASIITLFILFAVQSTATALLQSIASSLSHDLRQALLPSVVLSNKQKLTINRAAIVIVGAIALLLMTYTPQTQLLTWLSYLGSGTLLAAMTGPVFIATFWKGNSCGAFFSMMIGSATSLYFLLSQEFNWALGPTLGAALSAISYVLISLLTASRHYSRVIEKR